MKKILNQLSLWWKYSKQAWKMCYEVYPLMFIFSSIKNVFSVFFTGTLSIFALLPFLKNNGEEIDLEKFEQYLPYMGIIAVCFFVYIILNSRVAIFLKKKQEEMSLRQEIFIKEKLMYIPYKYTIDDDLWYKVNRFVSGVRHEIFNTPGEQIIALGNLYTIVLATSIGVVMDPILILVAVIYVILSFFIDFSTTRKNLQHTLSKEEQYIECRVRHLDTTTDFPTTNLLFSNQVVHFLKQYKYSGYQAIQRELERYQRKLNGDRVKNMITLVGLVAGLMYMFFQLQKGSTLNVMATMFLLWRIVESSSVVGNFIIQQNSFKEVSVAFEEIFMVSNMQKEAEKQKILPDISNGITLEFKNVSFHYPDNQEQVLNNFSGKFKLDQIFGLQGENGAGKTTLFKLIMGLVEPTNGTVYINSVNVQDIQRKWFQENFGVYDTDMEITEGMSVAEFLSTDKLLTLPKVKQISVLQSVIKQVGLSKKIPADAIETTIIGPEFPGGTGFSSGQEQRLLIARMLVSLHVGAKFVLIDEMTSNIAYADQKFFADLIKKSCSGGIIIAHNPIILDTCDSVLIVKNQKIFQREKELTI